MEHLLPFKLPGDPALATLVSLGHAAAATLAAGFVSAGPGKRQMCMFHRAGLAADGNRPPRAAPALPSKPSLTRCLRYACC